MNTKRYKHAKTGRFKRKHKLPRQQGCKKCRGGLNISYKSTSYPQRRGLHSGKTKRPFSNFTKNLERVFCFEFSWSLWKDQTKEQNLLTFNLHLL